MTVCVDSNVMLQLFGERPALPRLRVALLGGEVTWAVSTSILLEYEEVITAHAGRGCRARVWLLIERVSELHGTLKYVEPHFRFRVIGPDADDDKFSDCAVVGGGDYVITRDRHFVALRSAGYHPQPITPEDFIARHLPPSPPP